MWVRLTCSKVRPPLGTDNLFDSIPWVTLRSPTAKLASARRIASLRDADRAEREWLTCTAISDVLRPNGMLSCLAVGGTHGSQPHLYPPPKGAYCEQMEIELSENGLLAQQ